MCPVVGRSTRLKPGISTPGQWGAPLLSESRFPGVFQILFRETDGAVGSDKAHFEAASLVRVQPRLLKPLLTECSAAMRPIVFIDDEGGRSVLKLGRARALPPSLPDAWLCESRNSQSGQRRQQHRNVRHARVPGTLTDKHRPTRPAI